MGTRKPRTPTIKIDGSAIAGDLDADLQELVVSTSVHLAGVMTAHFADDNYRRLDAGTFAVGARVEVLLPDDSNSLQAVFRGEITSVGVEQRGTTGAGRPMLVMEARSGSHRLAAASTFKAYFDQKRSEVASEIAQRHGLTPEVEDSVAIEPYLLQAGTDHAFLTQLARGVGFEWFVDGTTLYFRARGKESGPTLTRSDESLIRFSARYTGTHIPEEVTVLGWDPQEQLDFSGKAGTIVSSPGVTELGSDAPFVTEAFTQAKTAFATPLRLGAPSSRDAKEAQAIARSIGLDLVSQGLVVEGVADANPEIVAGGLVTLDEVGVKLKGDYYVTEVEHRFGVGQRALTTFRSGGLHHEPPRLGIVGPGADAWGQTGFVIGVVTNVNDEEQLGRVKVRFPTLGEEAESDWARVIIPGVGKDRGFDFRPEVNDEVVVGFDRGDLRFPFVLGGVWSGSQPPKNAAISENGFQTRREVVSRVGHVIALSDGPNGAGPGDEDRYVEIQLADKATVFHLGEDTVTLEVKEGNELKIFSGDTSITFTDAGDIEIKAKNLKIEAEQAIEIKGGTDVKIEAGTNLKMEGKTKLTAKGAQAELLGSGMAVVKGGMVKIN